MAFSMQLSESERQQTQQVVQRGKVTARVRTRGQILLKMADGRGV